MTSPPHKASIIIPARDAMVTIGQAIESVLMDARHEDIELIVVNDGLDEATARLDRKYPVKVIPGNGNGIAAARNIGLKFSRGDILIFLDADCQVLPGWLKSHLEAHERYGGLLAIGGSFCLKSDATFWARCDHYCSWYNVGPDWPEAWVPNHPGGNISITQSTFDRVGQFREDLPRSGVHEDIEWQVRLQRVGGRIRFEPHAAVWHFDRANLKGYLKHNYQWGYNSILVKGGSSGSSASRFPLLYRKQWILIWGFLPFAAIFTLYTILCWLRAGKLEPVLFCPLILLGRIAYATGMAIGGFRAIRDQRTMIEK